MNAFPAEASVARAEELHAEDCAPYRYYAAQAYLAKAREEAGHGQYQDATTFAAHADNLAHDAVTQCRSARPRRGGAPLVLTSGARVGLGR